MARQKGFLKLSGTLGERNYYQAGGIYYSRKAGGGFNKTAIANKASMQKVREFNNEFSRCVAAKTSFRHALEPFLGGIKNRKLHGNMMRLFLSLKNLDPVNPTGKRKPDEGLKTEEGKALLHDFIFLPELNFPAKPEVKTWADKTEVRIGDPENELPDAERFEFSCGILEYDSDSASFSLQPPLITTSELPLKLVIDADPPGKDFLLVLELKCFREGVVVERGLKLVLMNQ